MIRNSLLLEFGFAGLSTAQLWIVVILGQVGGLLWLSRRISSFAGVGIQQTGPSAAAGCELSPSEWQSSVISHRFKQLKSDDYPRLEKLPPVTTERVVSHHGWRTELTVTRKNMPDGRLLITVASMERKRFQEKDHGHFSFVVRPDDSKEAVRN